MKASLSELTEFSRFLPKDWVYLTSHGRDEILIIAHLP